MVIPAVLVLAGVAFGLATVLHSSGSRPAATVATRPPSVPAATASVSSRPVSWLGMELTTLAPGAVVIETVQQGSPADIAALEPGEVILSIDGRPISNVGDIVTAIRGRKPGEQVTLQMSHGSALFTTAVTLAAPPSAYP